MRKWIALAALLVVVLAAGTVFFLVRRLNSYVDQNRFRIAREIGTALGRTVGFEDMRVSLAGGLSIRIDELRIADDPRVSEGDFVRADRVVVQMRLLPVLIGRFEIEAVALDAPEIAIIQTGTGFNYDSFGRRVEPIAGSGPTTRGAEPSETKSPVLTTAAPVLSKLNIRSARIRYVDRRVTPASEIVVDRLDLAASDLGSNRPAKIAVSASLFGSEKKNLDLSGSLGPLGPGADPAQLHVDLDLELGPIAVDDLKRWKPLGSVLPADLSSADPVQLRARSKGTLAKVALEVSIDASQAAVRYGAVFDKPSGVPLRLGLRVVRKGAAIDVERAKLEVATLEVSANGRVRASSVPSVDIDLEVPTTQLAEWRSLFPKLAGLELSGQTEARVHASGPLAEDRLPFLKGTIALRDVAVRGIPGTPRIEHLTADLTLEGDSLMLPETTFSLGGSQVAVRATGRNLAQPVIDFDARSAELRPQALGVATGDDALREVRVLGEMRSAPSEVRMSVSSDSGRLLGIDYEDLRADATTGDGVVVLNEATLRAFGGTIAAKGLYHGGAEAPIFELRASASDVLIGALLASRGSRAAATIEGRLRGDLHVRGAGRDWPSIRDTLRGGGRLAVDDGVLKDVNVGEDVLAELTSFGGLSELVSPELRERYPQFFGTGDTRFEELGGSVTIADARLTASDVTLRAPDYGIRAVGWFDLDQRVDFNGTLVLSKELTDDIASDVKEVRNFMNDARRLEIPFRLRGDFPAARPEPDAEPIARALRRALLERGAGDLIGDEKDGGQTPEQLDEGLRQLFGR